MSRPPWRIAGIHFDHMHMGDLLREVHHHPNAQIVGICHRDHDAMQEAIRNFGIPPESVFTDPDACMDAVQPDIVLLCPATADHARAVEQAAPHGVHILVEKPFAANLADADRMIAAMADTGKHLMINWPLRWYPPHITAKRAIDENVIGDVLEVHYYDGNRGPLRHGADKVETEPGEKAASWWYRRDQGGGSLLDYLGYGATLGTWFHGGKAPIEVTSVVDRPRGLDVDEHSVTIARYEQGLSTFQTRWGTFTDPWTHQPQPKCGFVIVGTEGTISSYDFEDAIRIQTREHPEGVTQQVDQVPFPLRGPIEYLIGRLEQDAPPEGPLSPESARIGQQIVDTSSQSAQRQRTLRLLG